MAGLLAIFAEFEREILRERTRAGLAHARENANGWVGRQPRPYTLRKSGSCIAQASANPRSLAGLRSGAPWYAASWRPISARNRSAPVFYLALILIP
jgi:hypothetical protein